MAQKVIHFIQISIFLLIFFQPFMTFSQPDEKKPIFLTHYMPWYQTKAISGYWGWHWTMNHYNPEKITNSNREIASHYYPITGPYDSSDDNILEYHVLLMKICGIDGVIVDWYGIANFWDYRVINDATKKLFTKIVSADLLFSICYEDQTIKHMVNNGHIKASENISHGKQVMSYMENHWFGSDNYYKLDNHPVLLNFGPQYFYNRADWDTLFSSLSIPPQFFTLENRFNPVFAGEFPWPPMWASLNGVLTEQRLVSYLEDFYNRSKSWNYLIGGAFPGFHDIYSQAGVGNSYGFLDSNNGATFDTTLHIALQQNPDAIQLITWNDYGEGTIIEPTIEFGYQYLEKIQSIKKMQIDTTFEFTKNDLQLPYNIFLLRRKYSSNTSINIKLDEVYELIVDGQIDKARSIIDSLQSVSSKINSSINEKDNIWLSQNYPNPFNPTTQIEYYIPKKSNVKLVITNLIGQVIWTEMIINQPQGRYYKTLNLENNPTGVYLMHVLTNQQSVRQKMILLK